MKVHVIPKEENKNILFFPGKLNYFTADNATTELVTMIAEGLSFDDINQKYPSLTMNEYDGIESKINIDKSQTVTSIPESQLDRLIINISNDCNMRCVYCYANQGTYGVETNMISIPTLNSTLDTFFTIFDSIGMLQLFGGEPTLNMDAIEFACEYLKKNKHKTQVGLVTNATVVNDRFIALINKYNIYVTVSVDTEREHDKLRPFPKGKESWELINKNIHKMMAETKQPTQIEFTYTKVHDDEDISILDILLELDKEYGNIPVHVAPVCSDDKQYHLINRERFINSVQEIYSNKVPGKDISFSSLKSCELSLKHRKSFDYFCGAGISTLAVSTLGYIYPCFYFIDNEDFKIANVKEEKNHIKDKVMAVRNAYYEKTKSNNEKCKECFAKDLCNGCLGANYTENGDPYIASDNHCNMTKGLVEEILKANI